MSEFLDYEKQEASLRLSVRKVENKIGGLSPVAVEIDKPKKLTAQIEELKTEVASVIRDYVALKNGVDNTEHEEDLEKLEALVIELRQKVIEYFISALETQIKVGPKKNFPSVVNVVVRKLLLDRSFASKLDVDYFADRVQAINEIVRGVEEHEQQDQTITQETKPGSETNEIPTEVSQAVSEAEKLVGELETASGNVGFTPTAEYQSSGKNAYSLLEATASIVRALTAEWVDYYDTNATHTQPETRLRRQISALEKRLAVVREKLIEKDPACVELRKRVAEIVDEVESGRIKIDGTQNVDALLAELLKLSAALENGIVTALNDPTISGDIKKHPEYGPQLTQMMRSEKELADKLVFAQWANKAEATYPTLATVRTQISSIPNPVVGNPEPTLNAFETALADAKQSVQAELSDEQKRNYLNKKYFDSAELVLSRLQKETEKYKVAEAVKQFELDADPLIRAITAIPSDRGTLLPAELERLSRDMEDAYTFVDSAGTLDKTVDQPREVGVAIDNVMRRLENARQLIARHITEAGKPKEVKDLTIDELARELLATEIPIENRGEVLKLMGRERLLGQAYYERIGSVDHRDPSKLDILRWKARIVLSRIDDAVTYEDAASGDVTQLEKRNNDPKQGLLNLLMSREQLVAATTANPEYGWQIRWILKYIIETASLDYSKGDPTNPNTALRVDRSEKLVRRGATKVTLPPGGERIAGDIILQKLPDGSLELLRGGQNVVLGLDDAVGGAPAAGQEPDFVIREARPDLSYVALANQGGRKYLLPKIVEEALDSLPPGMEITDADKRSFVKNVCANSFVSFDMLSIILAQSQHRTKTRGHNTGLEDINRIAFDSPLADAIHTTERYDNPNYFGNWIYAFYPEIPDNGLYGKGGDAETVNGLREKEILFLECFYDTSQIRGKLPLPRFCEGLFPTTYEAITLRPGESVQYGDEFYDAEGNKVNKQKQASFANYYTAQAGWQEFLEKVYQELPLVTYEQIAEQSKPGAKGGFFQEIISTNLGKAKMFDGPHMREAMPLLLTYLIYRVFTSYKGTSPEARAELFRNVVGTLKKSRDGGGLADYEDEVNQVLRSISRPGCGMKYDANDKIVDDWVIGPYLLPQSYGYRFDQRYEYLRHLWHEEHPDRPFPIILSTTESTKFEIQSDPDAQKYVDMLNKKARLKTPFVRGGKMIQVKHEGGEGE